MMHQGRCGASGNIQVDTTVGPHDQPEISAIEVIPNYGANPLPGTPTGLTASGVSANQIALAWNAVSGATGYDVFRLLAPDFTPSPPIRTSPTARPTRSRTPSRRRR